MAFVCKFAVGVSNRVPVLELLILVLLQHYKRFLSLTILHVLWVKKFCPVELFFLKEKLTCTMHVILLSTMTHRKSSVSG